MPTTCPSSNLLPVPLDYASIHRMSTLEAMEVKSNGNNFLTQLCNFIINVESADMTDIAGIHWQVGQATSIRSVIFYQFDAAGETHEGIFAEIGSCGLCLTLPFLAVIKGIRCG
jgi:Pectate lyase superfamily protein